MQELVSSIVYCTCILVVNSCYDCHGSTVKEQKVLNSAMINHSEESYFRLENRTSNVNENFNFLIPIDSNTKLLVNVTDTLCTISVKLKNEVWKNDIQTQRGLMQGAQNLINSQTSSPMVSYMLAPALTLAGIIPWIVPGIQIAAGVVQMMNQMAFMSGLTSLVRSYVFDSKPDEHVVYVNHGYGPKGHTNYHSKLH